MCCHPTNELLLWYAERQEAAARLAEVEHMSLEGSAAVSRAERLQAELDIAHAARQVRVAVPLMSSLLCVAIPRMSPSYALPSH